MGRESYGTERTWQDKSGLKNASDRAGSSTREKTCLNEKENHGCTRMHTDKIPKVEVRQGVKVGGL